MFLFFSFRPSSFEKSPGRCFFRRLFHAPRIVRVHPPPFPGHTAVVPVGIGRYLGVAIHVEVLLFFVFCFELQGKGVCLWVKTLTAAVAFCPGAIYFLRKDHPPTLVNTP